MRSFFAPWHRRSDDEANASNTRFKAALMKNIQLHHMGAGFPSCGRFRSESFFRNVSKRHLIRLGQGRSTFPFRGRLLGCGNSLLQWPFVVSGNAARDGKPVPYGENKRFCINPATLLSRRGVHCTPAPTIRMKARAVDDRPYNIYVHCAITVRFPVPHDGLGFKFCAASSVPP